MLCSGFCRPLLQNASSSRHWRRFSATPHGCSATKTLFAAFCRYICAALIDPSRICPSHLPILSVFASRSFFACWTDELVEQSEGIDFPPCCISQSAVLLVCLALVVFVVFCF